MIYFVSDCDFTVNVNDSIVENWNKAVNFGDIVYHVGDFTDLNFDFAVSIIRRLNGEIHFLPGSKDYWMKGFSRNLIANVYSKTGQPCYFEPEIAAVNTGYRNITELPVILCHYPMTLWQGSHRGSIHVFGHCKGNLAIRAPRSIDVSYNIFCKPININKIIGWLRDRHEV